MSNSITILANQTHPGDSSPAESIGQKYKGDGYYGRSDGFHTVQYNLQSFLGTVNIQASLAIEPSDDDWFTVTTDSYSVVNDTGTTGSFIKNFTGNYVWIRATITSWTDGTVSSIQLNH